MNKYAYITLLSTKDYLEAVLVLNRSLQHVKSKYPLIAACTPNIYNNKQITDILQKEYIIVEKIPWFEYSNITKQKLSVYHIHSVYNVGSKIEIFDLKNYDKLIYIDADALIIKNIDKLFRKKDGSTLTDQFNNTNKCFCALFIFKPKNHNVNLYKILMKEANINDGTLMELLWWHVIDNKYYKISNKFFYFPYDGKMKKNIKAYHLQTPQLKFWKQLTIPDTKLGKYYKKFLIPIRKQYYNELYEISLK